MLIFMPCRLTLVKLINTLSLNDAVLRVNKQLTRTMLGKKQAKTIQPKPTCQFQSTMKSTSAPLKM